MTNHKGTAQDFFLNLGVVVTLYTVVISFLSLVFDVINKLFPDALAYSYDIYSSGTRIAMASLIIVFPLFVWLSRVVTKIMNDDSLRRDVPVRRWLVYITLFLSSAVLIVDLVALLNTFLNGEITTRFILKVIAVLVVAGIVFWHYLSEIKGKASDIKYKIAVYGSSILVLALLVGSFIVFGSPATMRKLRTDETRLNNLSSIQGQIIYFWQQKGRLPEKLTDLIDPLSGFVVPLDPETNKSYTYTKTATLSFKLCSDFSLDSSESATDTNRNYMYAYPMMGKTAEGNSWKHGIGNTCFDRTIDPEFYPVNVKNPLQGL
jgi:hypothetical protein